MIIYTMHDDTHSGMVKHLFPHILAHPTHLTYITLRTSPTPPRTPHLHHLAHLTYTTPLPNPPQVSEALQTIIDTQPAVVGGSGGGATKESVADALARDLLSKVYLCVCVYGEGYVCLYVCMCMCVFLYVCACMCV